MAVKVAVIGFEMAYRENRDADEILGLIDELTHLPNLKAFESTRRTITGNYAFVMIDVDNFKNINDTHGHQFGDSVLKRLAEILKTQVGRHG